VECRHRSYADDVKGLVSGFELNNKSKEEAMTEQKDLTKLTATKLREIAKEYPEIQGAHAMKKEELIAAICTARGEPIPVMKGAKKKHKAEKKDVSKIKKGIRALKAEKIKALETGDKALLKRLRKSIKRLKRETRKVASA
jgi:hypothetical protein